MAFWGPTWWQRAKRLTGAEREAGGRKDGGAMGGGERRGGQEEKGRRREEGGRGSRSGGEVCKEEEWRRLATHNLHIPRQRLRSVLLDALLALQPDAVVWGAHITHVLEIHPDESDEKGSQNDADVQVIETDEFLEKGRKHVIEKCSQKGGAHISHAQPIHSDENASHLQETVELLEKGSQNASNVQALDADDEADIAGRSTLPRCSPQQIHTHQLDAPQKSSESVSRGMGGWDAEVEGSHVEVRLEDGRSFVAHACIGCDGIHSRMRRFVLGSSWTPLRYLGYIVVLGIFDNASFPLTQRRAFQTSDGRARLFAMPFTGELSMWQLSWAMPEEEAVAVSKSTNLLRAAALQVSSHFHHPCLY